MAFSFKPSQPATSMAPEKPSVADASSTPLSGIALGARESTKEKTGVLQIILYVVFGIAFAVTVALFAYQWYLNSRIESQKALLDQVEKQLGSLPLEEMRSLSNRMKAVSQVLNEHASVSTAFTVLEQSIEHPVTYTNFSLRKEANGYMLQLAATAPSYKAIAQQLDTLKSADYSKDFIPKVSYDGLTLDSSGKIMFNLTLPILIQGKLPETAVIQVQGSPFHMESASSSSSIITSPN